MILKSYIKRSKIEDSSGNDLANLIRPQNGITFLMACADLNGRVMHHPSDLAFLLPATVGESVFWFTLSFIRP